MKMVNLYIDALYMLLHTYAYSYHTYVDITVWVYSVEMISVGK